MQQMNQKTTINKIRKEMLQMHSTPLHLQTLHYIQGFPKLTSVVISHISEIIHTEFYTEWPSEGNYVLLWLY